MRFEYLISEKGKRVPGTERMVRNCQRPRGGQSLPPAQQPLCSGQEASSREPALGAEQGGLTPGWSQLHSSLGLPHQQSLARAFSHHTKNKIWPSYFRQPHKQHLMVQVIQGKARELQAFACICCMACSLFPEEV